MSEEIRNIEPKDLWESFYAITQIPRPSKKELKAAQFVKEYGEKLGLSTFMDEVGNVVISKPATPGYENRKTIVLQGHIDMVPQANSGSNFNFDTDPIDAYIDGDWVTARDTTLGADNGIGVAAGMAILKSTDIEHGPIEVLVTIDEETGMTGAFKLQPNLLKGDILINLDTEDENEISIGCAGGIDVNATWTYQDETTIVGDKAYEIKIAGLKGGHSGLDIHLGRGNASKLMGRLLKRTIKEYGVRLASINCGNMRNAIPREGFSVVTIDSENVDGFKQLVEELKLVWTNELGRAEPNLLLEIKEVEMPTTLIPEMVQDDLVNAVCAARNGIMRMSDSMPGVVETSSNLSIVKSAKGEITIQCLTRSFVDTARDGIASSLESCFQLAGAKVELTGAYPGWKPNPDSEILKVMRNTYQKINAKAAGEVAMHAGLECGILGATYPNWDMVSIGPTIRNPHSPDEKVHIASVERFWEFLKESLKNAPLK
ncbi:MAG: aminoacyl-histidine dipeptidase [Prolixibacteraceae bacterium]|jgi:dipeptidase D|nr:aminoacyl-histidine dipeptidase [Prolixibacteraceae bacterium]